MKTVPPACRTQAETAGPTNPAASHGNVTRRHSPQQRAAAFTSPLETAMFALILLAFAASCAAFAAFAIVYPIASDAVRSIRNL